MAKLKELTEEQKEILTQTRDEWVDRFFNTKEINKVEFEKGINWIYTDLLNKKKPKIIYCDSWLSCLLTIHIFKSNPINIDSVGRLIMDSVGSSVSSSISDSVRDSVSDSVDNSVSSSVGYSVSRLIGTSVGRLIMDSVGSSVSSSISDSVSDSVWNSVSDSVSSSVWDSVSDCSGYTNSYSNFGWVSFYDYFDKIGVLSNSNFYKYKELIKSGAFQVYEYENIVFAIQPPSEIHRNNQGDLHNVNGLSVKFRDGSGYYYVNGRIVESDLICKDFTIDDLIKEENEDKKAAMITIIKERHGERGLLDFLGAEIVDEKTIKHTEDYSEVVRLYKTKEKYSVLLDRNGKPNQPYCWSEITCPSTKQAYLIDNSADFDCALEAVKWLRPSFVPQELLYKWEFAN